MTEKKPRKSASSADDGEVRQSVLALDKLACDLDYRSWQNLKRRPRLNGRGAKGELPRFLNSLREFAESVISDYADQEPNLSKYPVDLLAARRLVHGVGVVEACLLKKDCEAVGLAIARLYEDMLEPIENRQSGLARGNPNAGRNMLPGVQRLAQKLAEQVAKRNPDSSKNEIWAWLTKECTELTPFEDGLRYVVYIEEDKVIQEDHRPDGPEKKGSPRKQAISRRWFLENYLKDARANLLP